MTSQHVSPWGVGLAAGLGAAVSAAGQWYWVFEDIQLATYYGEVVFQPIFSNKPEEVESIVQTVSNLEISTGKGVRVSEFLLSCMDSAEQELLKNKVPLQCFKFLEQNELTKDTLCSFTACIRTLANLVAELSGSCAQDVFANWNIVQDLTQRVFSSPFPHLIQEVGWLLGNLANHPSQEVQDSLQELSLDFKLLSSQLTFFTC